MMNAVLNEQLAPEVVQALIAQATASGLTVNEYLRRLLNLAKGAQFAESPIAEVQEQPQVNSAALAALRRIAERQEKRPFTKSRDTVAMLREARSGGMWGYEPTE